MATTNSATYHAVSAQSSLAARDVIETMLGFVAIMAVLWLPTREQWIVGPIILLTPLVLVLLRRPSLAQLGLHLRGVASSLWILPTAIALSIAAIFLAQQTGTYHALYQADLTHVSGYVLWTIYQQFLLQDYFMPRLTRLLNSDAAVALAATLFAVAHLPNLPLALATLVWGGISCALFRRYRSIWVLGLAQGLLGLCFAVCIPDALHHHMRVGLGFFHYQP